ncbi:MAG: hypothetical protein RL329_3479 [Bacteroidota bacterium]|jgi:hypothetical protein
MSTLTIHSLDEEYEKRKSPSELHPFRIGQVVNNQLIINKDCYERQVRNIFSRIRCGLTREEMLIKVYGHFHGADWAETESILGCVVTQPTKKLPLLTCKIEPLYATTQSVLPPFEIKRKKN